MQEVSQDTVKRQKWIMRPVRALPKKPVKTKKGYRLTWTPVTNATSYQIYRNRKRVKTVKAGRSCTWTDTKAPRGSAPTYSVITRYGKLKSYPAYPDSGKKDSKPSAAGLAVPKLKVSSKKARTISASWTRVSGATSYQVKATGKSARTCTGTHCEIGGLTPDKVCKVKVRAVRRANGKTTYSPWSPQKSVRVRMPPAG